MQWELSGAPPGAKELSPAPSIKAIREAPHQLTGLVTIGGPPEGGLQQELVAIGGTNSSAAPLPARSLPKASMAPPGDTPGL
jgi:hypothetical protein